MAHSGCARGRVRYRRLVYEVGIRSQGQVAVSATLGNIEHATGLVIEFGAKPLTECWAVQAQVDRDVEHRAVGTAYQLDLRVWGLLIVHAPQCPGRDAASHIDLSDSRIEPGTRKFIDAPLSGEEPAIVTPRLQFDHEHARDLGLLKNHV